MIREPIYAGEEHATEDPKQYNSEGVAMRGPNEGLITKVIPRNEAPYKTDKQLTQG